MSNIMAHVPSADDVEKRAGFHLDLSNSPPTRLYIKIDTNRDNRQFFGRAIKDLRRIVGYITEINEDGNFLDDQDVVGNLDTFFNAVATEPYKLFQQIRDIIGDLQNQEQHSAEIEKTLLWMLTQQKIGDGAYPHNRVLIRELLVFMVEICSQQFDGRRCKKEFVVFLLRSVLVSYPPGTNNGTTRTFPNYRALLRRMQLDPLPEPPESEDDNEAKYKYRTEARISIIAHIVGDKEMVQSVVRVMDANPQYSKQEQDALLKVTGTILDVAHTPKPETVPYAGSQEDMETDEEDMETDEKGDAKLPTRTSNTNRGPMYIPRKHSASTSNPEEVVSYKRQKKLEESRSKMNAGKIKELNGTIQTLQGQLDQSAAKGEQLEAINEELNGTIEALQGKLHQAEAKGEELVATNQKLNGTVQKLQGKLDQFEEKRGQLQACKAGLKGMIEVLQGKLSESEANGGQLEVTNEQLRDTIKAFHSILSQAEAKSGQLQTSEAGLKGTVEALQDKLSQAEAELKQLPSTNRKSKAKLKEKDEDIAMHGVSKSTVDVLQGKLGQAEAKGEQLEATNEESSNTHNALQSNLDQTEAKGEQLQTIWL